MLLPWIDQSGRGCRQDCCLCDRFKSLFIPARIGSWSFYVRRLLCWRDLVSLSVAFEPWLVRATRLHHSWSIPCESEFVSCCSGRLNQKIRARLGGEFGRAIYLFSARLIRERNELLNMFPRRFDPVLHINANRGENGWTEQPAYSVFASNGTFVHKFH